jgi:hypothetical protein
MKKISSSNFQKTNENNLLFCPMNYESEKSSENALKGNCLKSTFCCGTCLYFLFFVGVILFSQISFIYVNMPFVDRSEKVNQVRNAVQAWPFQRILFNLTRFSVDCKK